MLDVGFSDLRSLVGTFAIIPALPITVYFARRQMRAF